jgi:hypothetical protein
VRWLLPAALLVLSACPATKEDPPRAWLWTVQSFKDKLGRDAGDGARELGGFRPEEFYGQGNDNPWTTGMLPPVGANRNDGASPRLNALAGVAGGRNVAFAVTEVWQDAPAPWVEPVYMLQQEFEGQPPERVGAVESVFGVRWESGFYSPFWLQRFPRLYPGKTPPDEDGVKSVRDVLALKDTDGGLTDGALVICPFVPPQTRLEETRPFTGERLKIYPIGTGYADDMEIAYFDFGPDTFRATPRGVISRGFLYVFTVGDTALLPHVLPTDPQLTLLQRVEVDSKGFGVALPPQYDALITELRDRRMVVYVMDGGEPLAYAGHVVKNPDCFDGGFPSSCAFLDSEAAIRALPSEKLTETTVLVAAPRLPFADGGAP